MRPTVQTSTKNSRVSKRPEFTKPAAIREHSTSAVLAGLISCLVVAGLFSSARLVSVAEQQEFGTSRDRWTRAAGSVDGVASTFKLDLPAAELSELLYESDSESIVLGELAGGTPPIIDAPSATTQPSTTPSPSIDAANATSSNGTGNGPSGLDASEGPALPPKPPATTTTSPAPTTTLPPRRTINADLPLRIWAGGDSLGEYVGSRLQFQVADTNLSAFTLDYHISTGLTRPDYFDWPANLSQAMLAADDESGRPEAVVFMVGGNDDQPMKVQDQRLATNSADWLVEYRNRVQIMMDITAYADVRFYWIGLPPMKDERREAIAVNVNTILSDEASKREWVTFIDIVPLLLNEDGAYDQYVIGPNGEQREARERDGVHITAPASEWISQIIWNLIRQDWNFAQDTEATTTSIPESVLDPSSTSSP